MESDLKVRLIAQMVGRVFEDSSARRGPTFQQGMKAKRCLLDGVLSWTSSWIFCWAFP